MRADVPTREFVALEGIENLLPASSAKLDLAVTIDRLLEQLAETKPEWCTLVEVKYFLGLTDEEAAEMLGLKIRTMQRMWRDARQWLFEQMDPAMLNKAQDDDLVMSLVELALSHPQDQREAYLRQRLRQRHSICSTRPGVTSSGNSA